VILKKKSSVQAVAKVAKPGIQNIELIKRHEGLKLQAYLPTPNDKWTIGYGHTKTAYRGMFITEDQAEELLRQDVAWVEACITKLVKVKINQNQYDALASLIFNIGEGNFTKSSVLRELNQGNYQAAADAFMMWNKQRSKTTGQMNVLKGLTKRREEERQLFLTK
jgi:GH24 family phage-related lysozyme (muramidase)